MEDHAAGYLGYKNSVSEEGGGFGLRLLDEGEASGGSQLDKGFRA